MTDTINTVTDTNWLPDLTKAAGPKYIVLVQSMRGAIRSGALPKGVKMPPVRALAWRLGITPGTVARAYKIAVEEGLLEATVGRGTFVADSVARDPTPVTSLLFTPADPGVIDLRSAGVPDLGQGALIRAAMAAVAQHQENSLTRYPNSDTDAPLRQEIARWMGDQATGPFDAEDLVLTNGAQNAILTLLQANLRASAPLILTEDIGYPGFRYAAQLMRADLVGLDCDADGIRPDRLEDVLRARGGQILITSPDLHNPTCRHTPMARRQEIAEIARRYQLQIIEDESFSLSPQTALPGYRAICPERAWYVGSLSKTFSPSLRLGYVICAQGQVGAARRVAESAYFGLATPLLEVATELFRRGDISRVRDGILDEVRARVKMAVNIFGRWEICWAPESMFIWLRLPQGWRTSRFTLACEAAGVQIKPGDDFTVQGGQSAQAVRIGFNCRLPREQVREAMERIAGILSAPPSRAET